MADKEADNQAESNDAKDSLADSTVAQSETTIATTQLPISNASSPTLPYSTEKEKEKLVEEGNGNNNNNFEESIVNNTTRIQSDSYFEGENKFDGNTVCCNNFSENSSHKLSSPVTTRTASEDGIKKNDKTREKELAAGMASSLVIAESNLSPKPTYSSNIQSQPHPQPSGDFILPKPKQKPAELEKVIVRFRAVGDAPIMKKSKFKITAAEPFKTVIDFLRGQLKLKTSDTLFLYINQAFSPSPDELVANLNRMFATDSKLDIFYCRTPAWG